MAYILYYSLYIYLCLDFGSNIGAYTLASRTMGNFLIHFIHWFMAYILYYSLYIYLCLDFGSNIGAYTLASRTMGNFLIHFIHWFMAYILYYSLYIIYIYYMYIIHLCLDFGSNIGAYTLASRTMGNWVIALDPDPENQALLYRSLGIF